MKTLNLTFITLSFALFLGCNSSPTKEVATTDVETDSLLTTTCYQAIYEKDTANLQLEMMESGKVGGKLQLLFPYKPKNEGVIEGKFSGDTLYVDYTFSLGNSKEKAYKNPLAFLKKGDQLIMGVGVIETAYGHSYFAKDKPINFERGKYEFASIDCKR